ncbi:MAG: hypothetical protein R3C32_07675 [Chloroflexota bacterium]
MAFVRTGIIAGLDSDAANVRQALADTNEQLDGIGDDLRALRRDIKKATAALERQRQRGEALQEELRQFDTTTLALLDVETLQVRRTSTRGGRRSGDGSPTRSGRRRRACCSRSSRAARSQTS